MSANKNVNVQAGWGIPWLFIGLILYFGTSADNLWWGIHTQEAGKIILIACGVLFVFVIGLMLLILAAVAAGGGRSRRW